ncbi:MAG: hypothetical protein AAGC78_10360 [Cellvibrio sp.]|uniref:hypothetical protein n=1 Tax=Cellvibrio sp. TaxID=1965322 RepID=UPI0031A73F03
MAQTAELPKISGVGDFFNVLAQGYLIDRQNERANIAEFNKYAYDSLATSDRTKLTGFGNLGNAAAGNVGSVGISNGVLLLGGAALLIGLVIWLK